MIYTLSGPDAASFKLDSRNDGQIQTKVELDYEAKSSYTVTLTATDPLGATASITVNISVIDGPDKAVITGDGSITYDENGTGPVATFTATDSDGDAIEWTLGGEDAEDFTIGGGVLAFKKSPNYEDPADEDTNNSYEVTIKATGGEHDVVVMVANVDEAGSVSLSDLQPQVGSSVSATLNDPDGDTTRTRWQWSRSADKAEWTQIEGARSSGYTPVAADDGMYLRAMATYYDPVGTDAETAEGISDFRVESTPAINAAPNLTGMRCSD